MEQGEVEEVKAEPAQTDEALPLPQTGEHAPVRQTTSAVGILMVIAGVFSIGVPGHDPTNPTGLGILMAITAFVAAYGGFAGKRRLAFWCAQIVAWITLLAASWVVISGVMSGEIAAMLIYLVVGGGVACVLAFVASAKLASWRGAKAA